MSPISSSANNKLLSTLSTAASLQHLSLMTTLTVPTSHHHLPPHNSLPPTLSHQLAPSTQPLSTHPLITPPINQSMSNDSSCLIILMTHHTHLRAAAGFKRERGGCGGGPELEETYIAPDRHRLHRQAQQPRRPPHARGHQQQHPADWTVCSPAKDGVALSQGEYSST